MNEMKMNWKKKKKEYERNESNILERDQHAQKRKKKEGCTVILGSHKALSTHLENSETTKTKEYLISHNPNNRRIRYSVDPKNRTADKPALRRKRG